MKERDQASVDEAKTAVQATVGRGIEVAASSSLGETGE
jgi:hypothetical protein